MSDEIISKSHNDNNSLFADEDAPETGGGASRLVASWITSRGLTNAETVDTCSRNVQSFTTFRVSGLPRRELLAPNDDRMLNHQRESTEQRHARQLSAPKNDQSEGAGSALRRYENAVLRYQKPKARPKRQISRERRQQQRSNYSSSDESVARHKSKSTSSIDTQSVNNILDEYEDLDYRRSSDLSDVGSISVGNFEAVMMDQQKRQQQGKSKLSGAKVLAKSIPTREKVQPVLKVNQQTQVRQRSRDRQKDSSKGQQQDTCVSSSVMTDAIESGRSRMPEVLLRKGEVQKRVDEWLSQAHSQNFPLPREKPLTRSNSSAEKSQRRYRQDSRVRSIDEARNRLNGGTSSSYDDLTRVERKIERSRLEKINVGVNTGRSAYKEYLTVKSKVKQQDYGGYGAQPSVASSRSGDSSPASRIPQRGPLGSSFRSRRAETNPEERGTTESRIANLARARYEFNHNRAIVNSSKVAEVSTVATSTTTTATTTTSIIPGRRPSLKRSGNGADQNCAAVRSLVKEETTDARSPRGTGGPSKGPLSAGVGLGDQGDPISPNKDGESRRPAVTATGPTPRPADKAVETACKSMEAPARCAAVGHPRDVLSRIAESGSESRRRFQVSSDIRREYRSHDQLRQEQPIYGLPVGARVRALQGQAESRGPRIRCHQAGEISMEARKPPAVLPRKDFGASSSQDTGSQEQVKAPIGAPSSSFKPNNRAYTATSGSQQQQQLNEQNAARSKVVACEAPPPGRIARYASPDHVERIYERSLQPQVIHANDLESILRPSLQVSPYGEKVGVPRSDRESLVKETSTALENEPFAIGESRHEHLETIEEDDRKSESSVCKYPEIGLKQCLKVQQSLPNSRSKESVDKRKDDSSIYAKWDQQQQQIVLNEPAKTFATFQSISPCPTNVKPSVQPRSTEVKESKGYDEVKQNRNEPATILENFAINEDALQEDQGQLIAIHSRENSNLSTATIPVDELENQRGSRFRTGNDPLRNRFQFNEKSHDRAIEETTKDVDGAVVNEVLVKNLQFEQDLPKNSIEQTKVDNVQHVNFRNVLCDDYEKLKNKKMYMTKEEMDHQRLIDMLKKGDFEMLKMVSNKNISYFLY